MVERHFCKVRVIGSIPIVGSIVPALSCALVFALAACSPRTNVAPPLRAAADSLDRVRATTPIQHVVLIVQENRSVDDLFQAYPGADTVATGTNSKGQTIPLAPISLKDPYDIDNSAQAFFAACAGRRPGRACTMTGFDGEAVFGAHRKFANPQFGYVPRSEAQPYFDIAKQYVLADRMFSSQLDGSFVAHQYLIAAQASQAVNFPNGPWHCGVADDTVLTLKPQRTFGPRIPVCLDNRTLADELDAAGLTWHYYAGGLGTTAGLWSAYSAIAHVREGPGWQNVTSPPGRFLADVRKGTLANVTWITPLWQDSDHPSTRSAMGPAWVTSLVDAVGASPFWDSTAIFVVWDDWGGWYDHVAPPYADYDGLGVRVPLLVVSPYAKRGYVSHVQYEHASLLRFIEDNWGLAQLAASDARAADPAGDAFDFARGPRPFKRFALHVDPATFVNEADGGTQDRRAAPPYFDRPDLGRWPSG
jgi:phospholipase C